jgi:hypothetical protein
MLNLPKCIIKQASTRKVAETVSVLEEGVPLVRVMEDGVMKVTPCTGVADEYFLGYSQNRHTAPSEAPIVEEFTIPGTAPHTLQTSKVPLTFATASAIYIDGTLADILTTGTPLTGDVLVTAGGALTFAAADAGKSVQVLYRYAISQAEAAFMFGNDIPFVRHPMVETTIIEVGVVFTDRYNPADDWASADKAYLGADGLLTTDDTTGTFAGVVYATPAAGNGFLGIDWNL